jgi:aryl-alcohol dehydrogenase-like predicted oxidoreductase
VARRNPVAAADLPVPGTVPSLTATWPVISTTAPGPSIGLRPLGQTERQPLRNQVGTVPNPNRSVVSFIQLSRTSAFTRKINKTTRKLGNSDLHITPIGFGAWAAGGGDWEFSWGPQDDQESIAAIHKALELGVNWIDTAAVYGLGHSEEIVAQALKEWRGSRPHVFTKCVLTWNESRKINANHSATSIRRECQDSLRRLQVETIDLYQIHWPPSDNGPDLEESWQTLAALQKEGKVRWIGVSNFNVDQLKRATKIAPVSSIQPPYSILRRAVEEHLLPYCQQNNIGVIVYSPMFSGMLTGGMTRERAAALPAEDFRRRNPEFQEPKLSNRRASWPQLRRSGPRLGTAQSCGYRRNRRCAKLETGRRCDACRRLAPQRAGSCRNPGILRHHHQSKSCVLSGGRCGASGLPGPQAVPKKPARLPRSTYARK